jgi:hypothetical protein
MLLVRMPALLVSLLFGMPSSIVIRMPYLDQAMYASGAAMACLLVIWLIRGAGLWVSPQLRFFALGSLLALVPVCAVAPQNRVLIHAEIGMSGVISLMCVSLMASLQRDKRSVGAVGKVMVPLMLVLHLLVAPILTLGGAASLGPLSQVATNMASGLPHEVTQPGARVVLINSPVPDQVFYMPLVRSYLGLASPKSMWSLANGPEQALRLEVLDESTIRLASPTAFQEIIERDVRSLPFKPGDEVKLDGMNVTVEAVSPEGGALVARFQFASPMSDAPWQFYVWENGGFRKFVMPGPGQVVELPAGKLSELVRQAARSWVKQS